MAKTKTKSAWIERWDNIFTNMSNDELRAYELKLSKCVETPTVKRKIKMIDAHELARTKMTKMLMPVEDTIESRLMKTPINVQGTVTGRMTSGYDPQANAQLAFYKLITKDM